MRACTARSQVKSAARRTPTGCEPEATARWMPVAIESTSSGSTSNAMPCENSSYGRPAGATTGVPQAIASSTGSPKPS